MAMPWSGGGDRLRAELAQLTDEQLLEFYAMYVRALALDGGKPPSAAKVQYFVECWRELRCRRR